MNPPSSQKCMNCEASEAEVPLMAWHYQGREVLLCANCLPLMIHKREQLMPKLNAAPARPER